MLFAWRGKGAAALGLLISAKVNQWTLLIGSLPIAYGIGGGPAALHLDGRQVEEFLLTATQTLLGIAVLLTSALPALGGLDAARAVRGPVRRSRARPGGTCCAAIYLALAIVAFVRNRQYVVATLTSPFRRTAKPPTRPRRRTRQRLTSPSRGRPVR